MNKASKSWARFDYWSLFWINHSGVSSTTGGVKQLK